MNARTALLTLCFACAGAAAEVTTTTANGFVSKHELRLAADPGRAYQALTAEIHRWWDANHSHSGSAANFSLDARPGGCFCERLKGGGVEHMRVVFADHGRRLHLEGGLGPLQNLGARGTMIFELSPGEDETTRLRYRYAVSGLLEGGEKAVRTMADAVDRVQLGQLQRLQRYLATGSPTGKAAPRN